MQTRLLVYNNSTVSFASFSFNDLSGHHVLWAGGCHSQLSGEFDQGEEVLGPSCVVLDKSSVLSGSEIFHI